MNAVTPLRWDIGRSPAAAYAEITERIDALLNGFAPRDRAALMVIRAAVLQHAQEAPAITAEFLQGLTDEVRVM